MAPILTCGYAALNWPKTYPVYVAKAPNPRIKMTAGTIPIRARTDGSDKIPNEIVSAIITTSYERSRQEGVFDITRAH